MEWTRWRVVMVLAAMAALAAVAALGVGFRRPLATYLWARNFVRTYAARPAGPESAEAAGFYGKLAEAAVERTSHAVRYPPKAEQYKEIAYPGGDVPAGEGVCADEIIRIYRNGAGIDLQRLVHEDKAAHPYAYPVLWPRIKPDPNIDHRRVPNLATFFRRQGAALPLTRNAADYLPGDVVVWFLGDGLTHIGMVVAARSEDGQRPLVVHNIGLGPHAEDVLFSYTRGYVARWEIIGHFRYGFPP